MASVHLLSTKLHRPNPRPGWVARPRLVGQIEDGIQAGRRLTLVSAPAGFGKTTLITEWMGLTDRQVAWISLDESDDDPQRLLSYLRAALSGLSAWLPKDEEELAFPLTGQRGIVDLINRMARLDAGVALVLDDYHAIGSFEAHEMIGFLVENQPANVHLLIGTREDPPLPLARLRARDQITEIRERGLAFTRHEVEAFLNQTMALGLSAQAITALGERTEGWVTGLQLAGLALRQRGSAEEFVESFSGDDRYIVDYLVAEVLDRAPVEQQEFLRRSSILSRLSAPLCAHLTGQENAQEMLEQLEAANLFLVPLDNRREWYRLHGLFAEVLRLSLGQQEQLRLHREAAAWCEAHGLSDLAAYHMRAIGGLTSSDAMERRLQDQPLIEPLSRRELEVLDLVAAGYSNAEIARQLFIALGTVKRHINNTYGKLAVRSRTQALVKAREIGLIQ